MKEITYGDFQEISDTIDSHFEELKRNILRLIKCVDVMPDDDVLNIIVDINKSIIMIDNERLNLEFLSQQLLAAYCFTKNTGRDYWTNETILPKK